MSMNGHQNEEGKVRITYHEEDCICKGQCPLPHPDYYESYRKVAESIVSRLHWPNVEFQLLYGIEYKTWRHRENEFLEIFDDSLDGENGGMVLVPMLGGEMRGLVLAEIVDKLKESYHQSSLFTPHLHLLLWLAILGDNVDLLAEIIDGAKGIVPSCVLQALLLKAVQLHSLEAVTLLLANGALANRALRLNEDVRYGNSARPITACVNRLERVNVSEEDRCALGKILRLLFSNCGDRSPFAVSPYHEDDDYHTLEESSRLWKRSPETVEFLLEKGGPYLNAGYESPIDVHLSRLESCFHPGPLYEVPNGTFLAALAAGTFHEGILPLLRAGARIIGSFEQRFTQLYARLYRLLKKTGDVEISQVVWGRPGTFLDVMIECRGYNVRELNICELNLKAIAQYKKEDYEAYQLTLARFPLRLQSFARRAILKCLPFGLKSRTDAIKSLRLPKCLEDYLQFKEFDVVPQSLEWPKVL